MLMEKQNGRCAICGSLPDSPRNHGRESLCVDHNHITDEIRGLLCVSCNAGIGQLADDLDLLRKAVAYLETPGVDLL